MGFHLGTLMGYLSSLRLLAKFEFPTRTSNKICLKWPTEIIQINNFSFNGPYSSFHLKTKFWGQNNKNVHFFLVKIKDTFEHNQRHEQREMTEVTRLSLFEVHNFDVITYRVTQKSTPVRSSMKCTTKEEFSKLK